ncbi:MAG: stage II sporulation protein M [Clostridia bacterium]|nr:stage II sporulation protein M [Clostridia bacterium]
MTWFFRKNERKYLIISTLIFCVAWAAFYFGLGSLFAGSLEAGSMEDLYQGESFFSLFGNNLLHCLVCAAGFGILSVPMLIFDAASIGISGVAFRFFGGSFGQYLALLLPHCIFEIPALLLSCACGLKLFTILRGYIGGKKEGYKEQLLELAKSLIIVFVLVLIAALVEAYLTPIIAKAVIDG